MEKIIPQEDENVFTHSVPDPENEGGMIDVESRIIPLSPEIEDNENFDTNEMEIARQKGEREKLLNELHEKILDDKISDEERLAFQERINSIEKEIAEEESTTRNDLAA